MIGKSIRMNRLFDGNIKRGNVVVAAVDHGMFQGVQPGLENQGAMMEAASGADAILLGPGMIEHYPRVFCRRNSPVLMSRMAYTSSYCFPWGYDQGHTGEMFDPAYLQTLGAEIVVTSLQLRTGSESVDTRNAEVWGKIVMAKERLGLPLVGEFHPTVYENVPKDEWHDLIRRGCRILCELGADMIKTFYTDERFEEITGALPVPVLVLGSKKLPDEIDALRLAEEAVKRGARGVVFGRNIFQAKDPAAMIEALGKVVKHGDSAEDAAAVLRR